MISRAKLKDKTIVIELPLREPKTSASGKSIVIATTRGPHNTGIDYKGSDLFIVANAYTRNPEYGRSNENAAKKSRRKSAEVKFH